MNSNRMQLFALSMIAALVTLMSVGASAKPIGAFPSSEQRTPIIMSLAPNSQIVSCGGASLYSPRYWAQSSETEYRLYFRARSTVSASVMLDVWESESAQSIPGDNVWRAYTVSVFIPAPGGGAPLPLSVLAEAYCPTLPVASTSSAQLEVSDVNLYAVSH